VRTADALAAGALVWLIAGCASVDPYASAPALTQRAQSDAVGDCVRRFAAFDARVDTAGVRDAEAARVPGYPFLRADRSTLRSAPNEADPAALTHARLTQMAALDAQGRAIEAANARLDPAELADLERCRALLLEAARGAPQGALDAARPPRAYNSAARVVGLYPLTQMPFALGIASWQAGVRTAYATPFPELAVAGERLRYVPGAAAGGALAGLLPSDAATASAFGRPALTPARAWQLAQQHAPVLVVDTIDRNDRFGTVGWRQSGERRFLAVDDAQPVAYVRVAWAHAGGAPALQIIYTWWFPARPPSAAVDLTAGHLDALMWRVTLDAAGRPLLYDAAHACGCYHLFFPTERVRARPRPLPGEGPLDESMFAPQVVHSPGPDERMIIYVSGGEHQIQRVAVDQVPPAPGTAYRLLDADRLRTLPLPAVAGGGTRSAYGADGLVPGTERLERYLFWPMGVPSAGQLRQWGHHATAFVGRRTFDDPRLVDRYFTLAPGAD
jgi:hypothetical protein